MVLISRKVDYAILALTHLMQSRAGCSARELAARFQISRPFLANILKELCQHGFIESQRGIKGGYRLVRDPSTITMGMIIAALDGPFQLMSCAHSDDAAACGIVNLCPVKGHLRVVNDRIAAVLEQTTLEDLIGSDEELVRLTTEKETDGNAPDLSG